MINESVSSAGLLVKSFTIYKFLSMLAAPFTSLDAFQKGLIDSRGNFKEDLDLLLRSNKIDPLEVIIIKLKKILGTVPNPGLKASLNNQLTILNLFLSEMYKYDVQPHESLYLLEVHCLKQGYSLLDTLIEDTVVGGGEVSGLLITDIIGPKQENLPIKKKKLLRRKPLDPDVKE